MRDGAAPTAKHSAAGKKHIIKKPLSKRKRLNYNNIRRRAECLEDPAATYSPVP